MKLQVTQANLNRALSAVARVANSRNQLPILANVMLKTIDNRLSVSATNLDIAITEFIGAKISKEGSITVPARLTQDFISNLTEDVVELELNDNKLSVKTSQHQSTINGIAADDFPVMPEISSGDSFKLSAAEFKQALSQVVFAASNEETRPALTGVLFSGEGSKLNLAATDSYRLAEKSLDLKLKNSVKLLVPASALGDLLRLLADAEGEVEVLFDEQQVQFNTDEAKLVARQIDATYPDYANLIPQKFAVTARVSKAELTNVVRVSSLFARENAGSVTIDVSEESGKLSVHAIASQLGEDKSEAKGKMSGEGSVTLNSRYLLDALAAVKGDEVEFCFNGKLDATVLRSANDKTATHVIMPLKS